MSKARMGLSGKKSPLCSDAWFDSLQLPLHIRDNEKK